MLRFAPYVLKTLWRHRTRTLLTVMGSAIALFVFCFVRSIHEGLDNLAHQQDRTLVVFQANKFCPATSHLPQDYEQEIGRLPNVSGVMPIQVFTNNCRASLDVVVFYGVPPDRLTATRDFQLTADDWQQFVAHRDAAVVGRSVAARRSLAVGDRFSIGEMTVTVAGIFSSENANEESYIYTHLEFLQRRQSEDRVGTVTQLEVFLDDAADPQRVAESIDEMFRGGPVATDTRAKGAFQAASLADLVELIELSQNVGYACVALMIVLVGTTAFMALHDRIAEYAVLQTLGFSQPRIFGLVLSESLVLAVSGGALGVLLSLVALAYSGLAVGAEAVTIAFAPSWQLAGVGLLVSVLIGMIAGTPSAWQAARSEIVPALRAT